MNLNYPKIIPLNRAVFSFLNPGVFVVIAKLQKAEIRLRPFPEPPNSGGALEPPAPPLNTALAKAGQLEPEVSWFDVEFWPENPKSTLKNSDYRAAQTKWKLSKLRYQILNIWIKSLVSLPRIWHPDPDQRPRTSSAYFSSSFGGNFRNQPQKAMGAESLYPEQKLLGLRQGIY